jgi:alpha-galactosidase
VVAAARARGLGVGIWFNPSQANDYGQWQRDAAIIIDLWRTHGITQVKIDGIETPSWQATENLKAFFETVTRETGGAVVFNLDVTAGRRPGYFALNRYGTIFLENRYTDWANYYPHRTLRNLWMLSRWVPPQWFQIEFLNVARNQGRYDPGDPLSPASVGLPYAFAVTLPSQPLAWMEVSGLSETQQGMTEVRQFRALQALLQAQRIIPIGEEPDGASWTGFQALDPSGRSGHLIVYREPLAVARGQLSTLLPPGVRVRLEPVMGSAHRQNVQIGADGTLRLSLPAAGSFAVWRYKVD